MQCNSGKGDKATKNKVWRSQERGERGLREIRQFNPGFRNAANQRRYSQIAREPEPKPKPESESGARIIWTRALQNRPVARVELCEELQVAEQAERRRRSTRTTSSVLAGQMKSS